MPDLDRMARVNLLTGPDLLRGDNLAVEERRDERRRILQSGADYPSGV